MEWFWLGPGTSVPWLTHLRREEEQSGGGVDELLRAAKQNTRLRNDHQEGVGFANREQTEPGSTLHAPLEIRGWPTNPATSGDGICYQKYEVDSK